MSSNYVATWLCIKMANTDVDVNQLAMWLYTASNQLQTIII